MQRLRSFLKENQERTKRPSALEVKVATLLIDLNGFWGPSGSLSSLKTNQERVDAMLDWWKRASVLLRTVDPSDPSLIRLRKNISQHFFLAQEFNAQLRTHRRLTQKIRDVSLNELNAMVYSEKQSFRKIHEQVAWEESVAEAEKRLRQPR